MQEALANRAVGTYLGVLKYICNGNRNQADSVAFTNERTRLWPLAAGPPSGPY